MKRHTRRRPRLAGVGSLALVALLLPVFSIPPASAASANPYLDDFSASSGMITPESGNLSSGCGFSWSAQSVLDADLPDPSLNGFLESVAPTFGTSEAGGGHLSIQHWFAGGDQLAWRIPIALDKSVGAVQVKLVFDDPDWTVNPSSLQQFSNWTAQPGYESAFHRFTGITGYAPHDDNQVLPATWGIDGAGHQTLTLSLGMIEANTSTVIGFTGTAVGSPGMTGAQNIAAGVAYGTKLTADGTRPLADCHQVAYGISEAQPGEKVAVEPVVTDANGETGYALPPGSVFSLSPGGQEAFQIDATTGVISWSVPKNHAGGIVDVQVAITYPDHDDFATGSRSTISALFDVISQTHPKTPVEPTAAAPIPAAPISMQSNTQVSIRNLTGALPQLHEGPLTDTSRQTNAARTTAPNWTPLTHSNSPIITLEVKGSPILPIFYLFLAGLGLVCAAALRLHQMTTRRSASATRASE